VFTVVGVGATSFVSATQNWRQRLRAESAPIAAAAMHEDAAPR